MFRLRRNEQAVFFVVFVSFCSDSLLPLCDAQASHNVAAGM